MYLLIDEKGRKYLVKGTDDVHTNYGVIKQEQLTPENVGKVVTSHQGRRFHLLVPDITDCMEKARRGPQSVTLKDCSIIAGYAGLRSGSSVVEAGTGSGILSMFLANIIAPAVLHSYEVREDHAKIAQGNFEKFGIGNVEIKMKDIYEGIDERDLDLVFLDLPKPWEAVPHAREALKIGGYIVSYSPSIEQSKKFCDALGEGFAEQTLEAVARDWDMEVVRPHSRMIAHTGFLTFARLMGRE